MVIRGRTSLRFVYTPVFTVSLESKDISERSSRLISNKILPPEPYLAAFRVKGQTNPAQEPSYPIAQLILGGMQWGHVRSSRWGDSWVFRLVHLHGLILYIYQARRFCLSLLGPRFTASVVLCRTAVYYMERCGISCCIGRVPVLSRGLIGRSWGIS